MTAVGRIRIVRQYVSSPQDGSFPADPILGVDGYVTDAVERMAVLVGLRDSFARAQTTLKELAGLDLDDEAIRQLTHAAAKDFRETRQQRAGEGTEAGTDAAQFIASTEPIEVQIDAGKVNTQTGWRDVKMAVFCRRERGASATPSQWHERELPPPSARTVIANIEEAKDFTVRVTAEADRLKLLTPPLTPTSPPLDLTVLGDGGQWIWNLVDEVLPHAAGVLDVFHALEKMHGAITALWGEKSDEGERLRRSAPKELLRAGKAGLDKWIALASTKVSPLMSGPESRPTLKNLSAYFEPHVEHLNYAERLRQGRSIGSGLIEGSIKQLVNRRLKITGARWRVDHVGPLVEMAAVIDNHDWNHYWTSV